MDTETLKLRTYKSEDESRCLGLISSSYSDNGPRNELSTLDVVVVEMNKRQIGLAALEKNDLHDRIVVEYICVDSDYRKNGIGTKLHSFLLETYSLEDEDVLDISCYSEQVTERRFIERIGFKKYLDCYLNLYNPNAVKLRNTEYEISILSEFYKNKNAKELVKQFHIERYSQEHNDHLPVCEAEDVWEDYFDDGDSSLGMVLHDNERIYGTSFGYLDFGDVIGEKDKDVICFNGYAIGNDAEEEASNLIAIYSHQCDLVKERDVLIYTEVDSTERVSKYIQDWLPECKKIYERYQFKQ